jgi:CheY-like chemotaxis protein
MSKDLYTALKERRSYYNISNEQVIEDKALKEIIELAVKHTPSAFNSQTSRAVVLTGKEHDELWDMITEALREIVDDDQFVDTKAKMDGFKATSVLRTKGLKTPIVALTAYARAEDEEECLAAGMDDFLSKPFRQSEIKAMLTKWLPRQNATDLQSADNATC